MTGVGDASLTLTRVAPWWPHTHGEPALHDVALRTGGELLHRGHVGFRRLQTPADLEADGLSLRVNGVPVFARGAVWTPLDLRAPHAGAAQLRPVLERVVAAGMNMLRVPGTAAYESPAFYDLCDELGILVWQDFMFANLDYPESDDAFMAVVESEASDILDGLAGRPSLAVLCGGSEVAQQVAMMGLDPALADGPLYRELLPRLVRDAETEAPYVPSTPWGGDLPFRTDRGVANYYGVGAYRRPLEDARRAGVRFAAECLAFANVPDDPAAATAGVPRDAGADWDFEDVRDHYLALVFGVDPVALRSAEPDRYLELSRVVSGEVMAEVLGEWRRAGSPCQGALTLWLRDLAPGSGWGVLDHRGEPKVAFAHLARALAPVAVWSTDEGLGGIDVHVANDRPDALAARLRLALYRGFEQLVDEVVVDLERGGARHAHPQRRGARGPLRRRLLGLPLRPARPGPRCRQPRDADGRAALAGVSLPRRPAARPGARVRPRARGDVRAHAGGHGVARHQPQVRLRGPRRGRRMGRIRRRVRGGAGARAARRSAAHRRRRGAAHRRNACAPSTCADRSRSPARGAGR